MAIIFEGQTFPGLKEYIELEKSKENGTTSAPAYAVPVDAWIIRTLNATPVKEVLNRAINSWLSLNFGQQLISSILINEKSFPELFVVLTDCAQILGISTPYAIARQGGSLFNAGTAGTDDFSFIEISSTLLQVFSKEEATFVIGHECGHIAASHMLYHTSVRILLNTLTPHLGTLGRMVSRTAGIPLLAWSRRSEVTADRAGLLCCNDIKVAERALVRLITGFAPAELVDIDDYLRTSTEMDEFHKGSRFRELFYSHPLIPRRIKALRLFASSELYYDLSGNPRPVGKKLLDQKELNRRVAETIRP